jgi:hypothetical protein
MVEESGSGSGIVGAILHIWVIFFESSSEFRQAGMEVLHYGWEKLTGMINNTL